MEQDNQEMNIEKKEPELPETDQSPETIEMEESSQVPETDDDLEEPETPSTEPEEIPSDEDLEKQEPSKTQKFFQKALIWLIVIVIAFGSGFLLDHFLRYIPLKQDLSEARAEMQTLNKDLDELGGQIEQLRPRLEAANARISSLEDDVEMANARSQLYRVLASVNNARLDLFQEDIDAARIDLSETEGFLEELAPVIEEEDPELALSLLRRLELITDGLERDPETASIDLELFTKDLLALETLLFEE
jgi:cell division protein FtsB